MQYLLEHYADDRTDSDICKMLDARLGVSYTTKLRIMNLLVIAAHTPFFSFESIRVILQYDTCSIDLRRYINRMVNSGYLKTYNLDSTDMGTRVLYYITKKGYDTISAYINEECPAYRAYRLKSFPKTAFHDYGVGETFLSYLAGAPYSIRWLREIKMSDGKENPVRADALCIVRDSSGVDYCYSYIEQDTGSEQIVELVAKIGEYAENSTIDASDIMIFSFKKQQLPLSELCYSVKNLKLVLPLFQNGKTLKQLLPLYSANNSGSEEDSLYYQILSSLNVLAGGRDMRLEDLTQHIQALEVGYSPHRIMAYNRIQTDFCRSRVSRIVDMLIQLHHSDRNQIGYHFLLQGFSVYGSYTGLLCNYMPYIYYELGDFRSKIENLLSGYFNGLSSSSYIHRCALPLVNGKKSEIVFPNVYKHTNGYVVLEHIGCDIGGIIRVYHSALNMHHSMSVSFVLLVDSMQDVYRLLELSKTFCSDLSKIPMGCISFQFLLYPKGTNLFSVNEQGIAKQLA